MPLHSRPRPASTPSSIARAKSYRTISTRDRRAATQSIALPTLILWCDHDRIVPLEIGLKLRRAMPNSTLRLIQDCGHMPQEEQPEETMLQIRQFLGTPLAE